MISAPTERTASLGRPKTGRVQGFLFLILEGSRLDAGGMRVALAGASEVSIGRGAERVLERAGQAGGVTCALRVPDARMSNAHARIVRRDGGLVVEDAGSTNGTIVNGATIASKALVNGDVLELGADALRRANWPRRARRAGRRRSTRSSRGAWRAWPRRP